MNKSELRKIIREELQGVLIEQWRRTSLTSDEYWIDLYLFTPKSAQISSTSPYDIYRREIESVLKKYGAKIVHKLVVSSQYTNVFIAKMGNDDKRAMKIAKELYDEVDSITTLTLFQGAQSDYVKRFGKQ